MNTIIIFKIMSFSKKNNLKQFLIKLAAVSLAMIIVISVIFNLFLADKFQAINKILQINNQQTIESIKDKVRIEIQSGLDKERILSKNDAKLLSNFYLKIKKELNEAK
jgi:hypothetical protein